MAGDCPGEESPLEEAPMRQSRFRLPRAYRLKPVGQREDDALSQLRIGASEQSVLVPFSPGLGYIVA